MTADKFKSRKLLVSLLLFVVATVLLWYAKIGSDHWVDMVKWVFWGYCVGNVCEHGADAYKELKGTS